MPLIVSGLPGQVGGQVSNSFTRVNDLVPTLLEAAGIPAHNGTYSERKVEPMDGRSLVPILQGKAARVYGPEDAVGYELSGCQVVFKGPFKLIRNIPPLGDQKWRLYDLEKDPGESIELADKLPDVVQALKRDYENYANANRVLPIPEDFDMQSAALRYAMHHYFLPKLKSALPAIVLVLMLIVGIFAFRRRRKQ